MLLVSYLLKEVITILVLSESEVAALSVLPNKCSKILRDSPKTITAAILRDSIKLFVAVMGPSLQDSYCMTGHSNLKCEGAARIFLYFFIKWG